MIDVEAFATDWISAWNAHDLEHILSHYAPSIVFLSPIAQKTTGNGRVEGLPALRSYWRTALDARPDLRFEIIDKFAGHLSLTILYRNHRGQRASETFEFGHDEKVVRSFACYSQ